MDRSAYNFDVRAVSELLDCVDVLCVVLQQDGHLERGRLEGHGPTDQNVNTPQLELMSVLTLLNLIDYLYI